MSGTTCALLCSGFLLVGSPDEGDCPHGYLCDPAYSTDRATRGSFRAYRPQPGDILLTSNANFAWKALYAIAGTGAPGHTMLVVRMENGRAGALEAGFDETPWVRITPLDQRLRQYKGAVWVRKRKSPVSREQCEALTCYARAIDGRRYSILRLFVQLTPFRERGPLRTRFLGRPRGMRSSYMCSEAVLEALVAAGLLDAETTRPAATYPRDLFYDESLNPYINKHLKLAGDWEPPSFWRPGR